jgi:hypothetical protein
MSAARPFLELVKPPEIRHPETNKKRKRITLLQRREVANWDGHRNCEKLTRAKGVGNSRGLWRL